MWMVWTFVFVSTLIWLIEGSCFIVPPESADTLCSYHGYKLSPGQFRVDYEECVHCTCLRDGTLSCCGIGYRSGVFGISRHCKILELPRCGMQIVRRDDETQPC